MSNDGDIRVPKITITSFRIIFVGLLINFLYLFTLNLVFLIFSIILCAIGYLTFRQSMKEFQDKTVETGKFEYYSLFKNFMISNKRYFVFSIVGIVIAGMIVSQAFIVFPNYIEYGIDLNINYTMETSTEISFENYVSSDLRDEITTRILNVYDDSIFNIKEMIGYQKTYLKYTFDTTNTSGGAFTHRLHPLLFNYLKSFSTFPNNIELKDNTSILIIDNESEDNLDLNETNVSTSYIHQEDPNSIYTINTTLIWILESSNPEYDRILSYFQTDTLLLTDSLEEQKFKNLNDIDLFDEYKFEIFINKPVNDLKKSDYLDKVRELNQNIIDELESFPIENYFVDSDIEGIYNTHNVKSQRTGNLLFLLMLPMFLVSVLLLNFAFELYRGNKIKILEQLYERGVDLYTLLKLNLLSQIFVSGVALIPGYILSLLFSVYLLGQLNIENPVQNIIIPIEFVWQVPLTIFMLVLISNFQEFYRLAALNNENVPIDTDEKTEKSFVDKYKIDVTLFLFITLFWIIVRQSNPNSRMYNILLEGFGGFMTILLIIVIPILVLRYFHTLLEVLLKFTTANKVDNWKFTLRSMSKGNFNRSLLVSLLIICLILLLFSSIIPTSVYNSVEERSYYKIGADVSIVGSEEFTDLEDLATTEGIDGYSRFVKKELRQGVTILGIDPNSFKDVAYWNDDYASQTLESLLSILSNNKTLMSSVAMKYQDISINDNVIISTFDQSISTTIQVGGSFQSFPNLVDNYQNSYDNFIVAPLDQITKTFKNYHSGFYIKLQDDVKPDVVYNRVIESDLIKDNQVDVSYVGNVRTELISELDENIFFTYLNFLKYFNFVAMVLCSIMYGNKILGDRIKELSILQSFGMSSKRRFKILLLDGLIIQSVVLISGILLGIVVTSNYIIYYRYQSNQIYPQYSINLQYGEILLYLLIFVFSLFGSLYFFYNKYGQKSVYFHLTGD